MNRLAVIVTTVVLSSTFLSGCGTSSYCESIESNQDTLNSFGEKRTNAAYEEYAKVMETIAADAPKSVRDDWKKLAEVTAGVLKANEAAGIKLEDMTDTKKLGELKPEQLTKLNDAYKAFNDTTKARAAVVKNAKQECEITLK